MASIKLKGDTSGEITISAPSVAGTTTLELPATSSTLATQNSLGVRNLIINGNMQIAQRGTSATGITGGGYLTVDRWQTVLVTAGTWTSTQDTDVPTGQGFANSHKFTCTTANASLSASSIMLFRQAIEGQNLQHLKKGTSNAESLTISFWVKSNKTGTYILELFDLDNTRQISKSYTINTADTWEKKTITFDGDTTGALDNDNGVGIYFSFWMAVGSDRSSGTLSTSWSASNNPDRIVGQVNLADSTSNYINITGVQLEVGTEATPFEHRPYDMELARCQRYYNKTIFPTVDSRFGLGQWYNSSNWLALRTYFPTTMRTAPTGSSTTGGAGQFKIMNTSVVVNNLTFLQFRAASDNSAEIFCNSGNGAVSGTTGRNDYLTTGVANVYISFDAEL